MKKAIGVSIAVLSAFLLVCLLTLVMTDFAQAEVNYEVATSLTETTQAGSEKFDIEFNLNDGEDEEEGFGSHITSTASHVSTILVVYTNEEIDEATVTLEGYDESMNPIFELGKDLGGVTETLGSTLVWRGGLNPPSNASEFIVTFENTDYGKCHEFSATVTVGDEWETKNAVLCNTVQKPPDVNVWATDGTNNTGPGDPPLLTGKPFAVGTDIWAYEQSQTATVIFEGLEPEMEAEFWFEGDDSEECVFGGNRCTWNGILAEPQSPTVMGVSLENTFYMQTRTFTVTVLTDELEQSQSVIVVNNTEPPPPPPPDVSLEFVVIDDLNPENHGQVITTTNRFVVVGVLYQELISPELLTIKIEGFSEELLPELELGDGLDPTAMTFANGVYTYKGILNPPFRPNEFIIRTSKGASPGEHEFTFTVSTSVSQLSKTVKVINPWQNLYMPMVVKP